MKCSGWEDNLSLSLSLSLAVEITLISTADSQAALRAEIFLKARSRNDGAPAGNRTGRSLVPTSGFGDRKSSLASMVVAGYLHSRKLSQ